MRGSTPADGVRISLGSNTNRCLLDITTASGFRNALPVPSHGWHVNFGACSLQPTTVCLFSSNRSVLASDKLVPAFVSTLNFASKTRGLGTPLFGWQGWWFLCGRCSSYQHYTFDSGLAPWCRPYSPELAGCFHSNSASSLPTHGSNNPVTLSRCLPVHPHDAPTSNV
ncbi:uncharacterized protein BJX67DRAFT_262387 [Aspergillus lucknowensis]|uniref:Uncharacterized protein n=1 Tax=Aspergillus lucknowensis TaxID=176173 RepID=A0ABR4LFI4_9EURO